MYGWTYVHMYRFSSMQRYASCQPGRGGMRCETSGVVYGAPDHYRRRPIYVSAVHRSVNIWDNKARPNPFSVADAAVPPGYSMPYPMLLHVKKPPYFQKSADGVHLKSRVSIRASPLAPSGGADLSDPTLTSYRMRSNRTEHMADKPSHPHFVPLYLEPR
jgi:hypothetical protein